VFCFAASPVVAALFGLATLRPVPAEPGGDRTLYLGPNEKIAAELPGRPALSLRHLTSRPDFAHLPFDELWFDPGLEDLRDELLAVGFAPTPTGTFVRPRRWSLLERWHLWQLTVQHATKPIRRCEGRLPNGGWGCGRGVRLIPDVIEVDGRFRAVARLTAIPPGTHLSWSTTPAPQAQGTLIPLSSTPVQFTLARGENQIHTRCQKRCPLQIPDGTGPFTITTEGPSGPVAIDLWEQL